MPPPAEAAFITIIFALAVVAIPITPANRGGTSIKIKHKERDL
jgi:hypothetical protein